MPSASYTTIGIVLRRIQYGETDNILTMFTREHGKLSAIAKGARKAISKFSGATEVLACSQFHLAPGRNLEIVTQAEIHASFPMLRRDLVRMAHALYLVEVLDHNTDDGIPNPAEFDLLFSAMLLLERAQKPDLISRWFELQLLNILGYSPNLDVCAVCHEPLVNDALDDRAALAISASLGGALCAMHAHPNTNSDHSRISLGTWNLMIRLSEPSDATWLADFADVDSHSADQLRLALRRFIRFRSDRELKSLEFLDSLQHMA